MTIFERNVSEIDTDMLPTLIRIESGACVDAVLYGDYPLARLRAANARRLESELVRRTPKNQSA